MQATTNSYKGKIEICDREKLIMEGVLSILTFDDGYVLLDTTAGDMFIEGENLAVLDLNKDSKRIIIVGLICTIGFNTKKTRKNKRGVFS